MDELRGGRYSDQRSVLELRHLTTIALDPKQAETVKRVPNQFEPHGKRPTWTIRTMLGYHIAVRRISFTVTGLVAGACD